MKKDLTDEEKEERMNYLTIHKCKNEDERKELKELCDWYFKDTPTLTMSFSLTFDKIDEKNKNPELTSINTFNDTVKKANEIKDRVLKYVYNIKQERSYNNDMVGIFERYKDIADGDMEVAMNFIKEAYPFNEETEVFIRKKFDMSIPVPIPDELK